MSARTYATPPGGLPDQKTRMEERAVFTDAYAFIPRGVHTDIVTTRLPHWRDTRFWVLARPLSGFAETFSQSLVEIAPGGGSENPETDPEAEAILFVLGGAGTLTLGGDTYPIEPGHYAFCAPGERWSIVNGGGSPLFLSWLRKRYEEAEGVEAPQSFLRHDRDVEPIAMPDTDGKWATSRFVDPDDVRHDMHQNIVTFQPGGRIPFPETHVMEHGIYVLQGSADYMLNQDWVAVEAGDFMWLRAFCPQACTAKGHEPFRYLLYKDMHRHPGL